MTQTNITFTNVTPSTLHFVRTALIGEVLKARLHKCEDRDMGIPSEAYYDRLIEGVKGILNDIDVELGKYTFDDIYADAIGE